MSEERKPTPEVEQAISLVDSWFADREEEIRNVMEGYRAKWAGGSNYALNLECRTLSEMAICWSLEKVAQLVPLPGFKFVSPLKGWVDAGEKLVGKDEHWAAGHGFLLHKDSGVVVCLTFGQFVLPFEQVAAGKRVEKVLKLAPCLVLKGDGGIALLRGEAKQIKKELDLSYKVR